MPTNLISKDKIRDLANTAAGLKTPGGDQRLKTVMARLLNDLFVAIDDLDISMDEVWAAVGYLTKAAPEYGLVVPGVGLERFLDMRLDEAERLVGLSGGTPRAIEGPLYVAGAPVSNFEARLDDGTDDGEVLFMEGQVRDLQGHAVPHATIEVWHANTMGHYSFFGPPQSPFNLRRKIVTDSEGLYRFRTIMPSGYGCPPGSSSEGLMHAMGRHGMRPAHVHFFVEAPGYRKLTTQINIEGDKYLHDDFAFGTRDELIPPVERVSEASQIHEAGLNAPFARIKFNFNVIKEVAGAPSTIVHREHAPAAKAA
jgi:catechol 1,2-dioxygenase